MNRLIQNDSYINTNESILMSQVLALNEFISNDSVDEASEYRLFSLCEILS